MTKDELVEKCARAMSIAEGYTPEEWDETSPFGQDWLRGQARAALAIAMPAAFAMAAEVAKERADLELGGLAYSRNYAAGIKWGAERAIDAIRAEGEKWK